MFIYLVTPDIYKDKLTGKSSDPKWMVTQVLDSKIPEQALYMKELNELNDEVAAELLKGITKGKQAYRTKSIFTPEEDDQGNLTGKYLLKLTTKNKPVVKDSQGTIMSDAVVKKAYSGTLLRAIISIKKSLASNQKTVGLTTYLNKVQIIDLVEGTGGGGDFDSVDDGYTVDTVDADSCSDAPQF